MKLNKYFLIGAMGLGLFACSDDLDGNGGQDGNQPQEGTTYAAISLKFGNTTTARAAIGDGPTTGTENQGNGNEADIKTVRLIVANAGDNKVEYNQLYTKDDETNPTQDKYVFAIQPGEKKIYAFVNEENESDVSKVTLNQVWDGTTSTVTKKASELGTYNETSGQGTPFVMSVTEVETWDILSDVSQAEARNGAKNQVALNVERMVAKVTVQLDNALVADDGFADQPVTLTGLTAQIGNADNITYDKNGNDEAAKYKFPAKSYRIAHDVNNVRQTPAEYYKYANNTADFYTNFDRAKLLSGNAESLYISNPTGGAKKNPQTRFYCLENTHATYVQANTTFVRVAATMTANKVVKITYKKAEGTEGQDGYKAEEITPTTNNENTTAGTFYLIENAPNHDLIGGYILESELAGLYGTGNDDITSGIETEPAKQAEAVIAELGKNNRGYAFSDPYTGGKGYFNVWVNDLKDANGNYTNKAPVFRNDWYALTINNIKLPGNPTPDIDPEKPLHPDTHIGVTVTVKAWNFVRHDIDLQ